MTKKSFLKAIQYQRNSIRVVEGVAIAKKDWSNTPWMIVENEDTWEEVAKDNFAPILAFHTADELYKAIYK